MPSWQALQNGIWHFNRWRRDILRLKDLSYNPWTSMPKSLIPYIVSTSRTISITWIFIGKWSRERKHLLNGLWQGTCCDAIRILLGQVKLVKITMNYPVKKNLVGCFVLNTTGISMKFKESIIVNVELRYWNEALVIRGTWRRFWRCTARELEWNEEVWMKFV